MAAVICYATCWSCKFGYCYEPPQAHTWGDSDDFEAAKADGRPEPGLCACPCAQEGTNE